MIHLHSFLGGGVAVADGNGVIGEGVKVNGDAVWGADFVLAAVAFADIAIVVPHDVAEFFFELVVDLAGFGDQLGFVL